MFTSFKKENFHKLRLTRVSVIVIFAQNLCAGQDHSVVDERHPKPQHPQLESGAAILSREKIREFSPLNLWGMENFIVLIWEFEIVTW